ncbi:ankyrin repeat-containing domain protein [Cadophora sp. MPI-SDFR-AT-0126]|nr:ankyrin repeat-containing domain protein [Leotiomycetes sp. MPI-SDFR-AT-0126]
MNALELPSEILNKILVYAVFTRRLKRSLRLRLVCKTFSTAVITALFDSRLLDGSGPGGFSKSYGPWQIRNREYLFGLFHRYLVYRLNNERSGELNRLLEMREIATLLREHSTVNLSTINEKLCWLGYKYAFPIKHRKEYWKERGYVKTEDGRRQQGGVLIPNRGLNLLAAAAYFDLVPLVLQLLTERHAPDTHNYMFPSALEAAAWAGNSNMVQTLQSDMANQPGFAELDLVTKWIKLAGKRVIIGATIRGDLQFLKWSMYPEALGPRSDTILAGEAVGQIARESKLGTAIYAAQRCTRSPEIHKYLQSFLNESLIELEPNWLARDFCNHCEWGNTSMVEYYLDNGVNVNSPWRLDRATALCIAAQSCQEPIVDLLLARGADPNFNAEVYSQFTPLPLAASSGSLAMVRKLLDHGAYPNEKLNALIRLPALWYAVATENTAMIHLLEARGASFDVLLDGQPWIGGIAMEMAEELFLDSMFDLLKERGIQIGDRLNDTGCAPWRKWNLKNNPPRNNPNWEMYKLEFF